MASKLKRLTMAQLRARETELIDTKANPEWRAGGRETDAACRFLEKAVRLYGRSRVERLIQAQAACGTRMDRLEVQCLMEYWTRWRARRDRHLVPMAVLREPHNLGDQIVQDLVFAPRVRREVAA